MQGSNWGYDVPPERQRIAHALIDKVGFDMIHGHSSHHPIGVEVYRGKLIMYGCGDFINGTRTASRPDCCAAHHAGHTFCHDLERGLARGALLVIFPDVPVHSRASHVHQTCVTHPCSCAIPDYEGIEHHYAFRGDLAFAFVPTVGRSGELISLEFWPLKVRAALCVVCSQNRAVSMQALHSLCALISSAHPSPPVAYIQIQRFQLVRAQPKDVTWLAAVMDRECGKFGGHLNIWDDGILKLSWS